MTLFQLSGALLAVIVFLGYINRRFIGLPDSIGVTVTGVGASLLLYVIGRIDPGVTQWARDLMQAVDFSEVVFHGMLGILLFAGAISTDFTQLRAHLLPIFVLSTLTVAISTFVVGVALHLVLLALSIEIGLVYCFMFGALISPTDPVAVMAVLKKQALPEPIRARLVGEGLFNDGTGVVAFLTLAALAAGAAQPSIMDIASMLAVQIIGGVVFGGGVGLVALWLLRQLHDSYALEIMLTLTLSTGGYALAEAIGVSAPIAVVVMGLMIGSLGRRFNLTAQTRAHLFIFWELSDELMNLLLFGLIGIHLLALDPVWTHFAIASIAIPVVLIGRYASLFVPFVLFGWHRKMPTYSLTAMTWCGLRGAISIALVLSISPFEGIDYIITATYSVVIFSLIFQALSIKYVTARLVDLSFKENKGA